MPTKYSDYMPGVIKSKHQFFTKIIEHFIPHEPELEIWGSLPKHTNIKIKKHQKSVSFIRKYLFKEKSIHLTKENHQKIISELNQNDILEKITWGLIKNDTPLTVCSNWNDHVIINGSHYSPNKQIDMFMNNLVKEGIITDFEEIKDDE